MASSFFTFADALDHARQRVNDDAQRRWKDADLMTYVVPGVLQQLYADRPDLFLGSFGSVNLKPSITDALPFDDAGFSAFWTAIVAAVQGQEEESVGAGVAGMAEAQSERARKG